MSYSLNQLDEILYHSLQPWIDANLFTEKFEKPSRKTKIKNADYPVLYEFDFYRPFNVKLVYYHGLIINETNRICSDAIALINEDENLIRQQYWFDMVLKETLPTRLTDVIAVIKEKQYFIEYIDPKKGNFEVNPEHKTDTFILQLLKIAFVKLYLEIQGAFEKLCKELPLSEKDIYDRYFNQAFPENSFLKRTDTKLAVQGEKKVNTIQAMQTHGVSRLSLTYKNFSTGSDKLSDLFKYMKEHKLIAKETPLASFKRVFSGKEIASPVIWVGTSNEFYYFIDLIHSQYQVVETIPRNFWKVVCKCFLKGDGTLFNPSIIKEGTKPKSMAEIIEKAVDIIK